jgi:hypothetical protein
MILRTLLQDPVTEQGAQRPRRSLGAKRVVEIVVAAGNAEEKPRLVDYGVGDRIVRGRVASM